MKSESAVQTEIRLAAAPLGDRLWRNNNGACESKDGRQIRYGLANDSMQINKVFKSSDLIGITQRVIVPGDVGQVFGIFTACEVKREGWHFTNTPREAAQLAYHNAVRQCGGFAGFAVSFEDYLTITKRRT